MKDRELRLAGWLGALSLCGISGEAMAQALPAELGNILREAKPAERGSIEDIAKRLYPDQRDAIDDLIDQIEDEEKDAVEETGFLKGWEGEGSFGASLDTGNTEEWGANAGAELTRKGNLWEHRFTADINIREVDGTRTEERWGAGYRAKRDFQDSLFFAFGSLEYERNPFQGIGRRFTEVVGVGYQIIDTDKIDWEATAGPALRQTRFLEGEHENEIGAFFSTDFDLDLTDTLSFGQGVDFIIDGSNTTFASSTAITSDVYGNISARLSFDATHESNPVPGTVSWDTTTRLSVVFGL